ncbi:MAG: TVP38/TMEM64 family protein [Deltaproteobacteria bacterium]|nr:TVP38/TMEM64 family protein [Deltaproteobacteria bacterium]
MKARVIRLSPYIVRGAALLLLIVLGYIYIPHHGADDIKSFVNGFGNAAPLAFIIICIIKPVIFFLPSLGLTIVAGTLFGPWYGTIYVAIGGAGSTVVGFYMTRWFGRKWVEQFLKGREKMLKVDEKMEKAGFKTTLMLRLFSLPWDIVSYSAGLSRVKFMDFYIASLIALIPTSFIYTYFGSTILNPFGPGFILSFSAIIILGGLPYIVKKVRKDAG